MTKFPVSLCMIAKNEEKMIERAVKSAQTVMKITDVVVVDTGSTDKTTEIAKNTGADVYHFKWCDDFAAAKNFAVEKAKNDWVFVLDADEVVIEADMKEITGMLNDENCIGTGMMIEISEKNIRHPTVKIFNRKAHYYKGKIHEQVTPYDGYEKKEILIPLLIEHYGYLPGMWEEKGKFERNISMLEKALSDNPDDPYYLYHLGKCWFNFDRDLEKACHYFEKALQKCDNINLSYIYSTIECYGYALINTGKYREALSLLEVYAPFYKAKPEFRFLMAHIYQNNAMFIEAVDCYESCIGVNFPHDTKGITSYLSYYNIGVILECLNMTEDAIGMYENCGGYEPAKERLKVLKK